MVSFLISLFHTKRTPKHRPDPADPMFFVGTWQFKDHRERVHRLEIDPDLKLLIDGKDMSAKVSLLTRYELSYVDKFGYKLEIRGNEARPIKFYDESENYTYDLQSANEIEQSNWVRTYCGKAFLFWPAPYALIDVFPPLSAITVKDRHRQKDQLRVKLKAGLIVCLNKRCIGIGPANLTVSQPELGLSIRL